MALLSSAYLDDYQRITLNISKKYHNGESGIFCLRCKDRLDYLLVESRRDFNDCIRYTLKCDEIDLNKSYEVVIRENYSCPLQIRYIVKTDRFNRKYDYKGNDLGAVWSSKSTTFKVWAPTATALHLELEGKLFEMVKGSCGVYETTIRQNCLNQKYRYLACFGDECHFATDPYAKASAPNSGYSVVCRCLPIQKSLLKQLPFNHNALIMEASVADYTKEGTFRALTARLKEISESGFTHLQLMPISDFATVDDYHQNIFYNWGYDPMQYQVLEGRYSSDYSQPALVNSEFRTLVETAHACGLKIVVDMVFNHHYSVDRSCFNRLVPYYWFRYENDELCEGTWCGNEFDTQQPMCRKYLCDTLRYFIEQYDVDGFRFDLMNFIDIETMNRIAEECHTAKKDVMLYGEGWNMKAGADPAVLSTMTNAFKLPKIAFFNDRFRDTLRGNNYHPEDKGYGSGNLLKSSEMVSLMQGNGFEDIGQRVNYVECHDNKTLYDLLTLSNPDESAEIRDRRSVLINGCVLFSNGIRMFHAGQQFGLSKNGLDNTYNGTAEINSLVNKEVNPAILHGFECLQKIHSSYIENDELIFYRDDWGVLIGESRKLILIINPSFHPYTLDLEKGELIFNGTERVEQAIARQVQIEPVSFAVIKK